VTSYIPYGYSFVSATQPPVLDSDPSTEVLYGEDNDGDGQQDVLHAYGLQLFDIAALQDLYGRQYNTRTNNDTYTLNQGLGRNGDKNDAFIYTIWDGGGDDTIDASSFDTNSALIDLRQGAFSSIGTNGAGMAGFAFTTGVGGNIDTITTEIQNVAIAFHTVIENATGTDHGDILIGNAWGNVLDGGAGDDFIYGDGVVYDGDAGFGALESEDDPFRSYGVRDGIHGAADDFSGDDTLIGGAGDDHLFGGAGTDTADYSQDFSQGGTNGITVTLNAQGNGTAIDGFGDTDMLRSIENVMGTSSDDTFTLDAPGSGITINGGSGRDSVRYKTGIIDYNNDGKVTGADAELTSIESITVGTPTYMMPYHDDFILSHTRTGIHSYETAPSGLSATFDITLEDRAYEVHRGGITVGGRHSWEFAIGEQSIYGEIALSNGVTHEGYLVNNRAFGWDLDDVISDIVKLNHSFATLAGTNHGDTFNISSNAGLISIDLRLLTGTGDDTVYLDPDIAPIVNIDVNFNGGHDVVYNAEGLDSLSIWNGISLSDIGLQKIGSGSVFDLKVDAGSFGSVTLKDISAGLAPEIILQSGGSIVIDPLSGAVSLQGTNTYAPFVEGTNGVDFWNARDGVDQTFDAGESLDVMTGGTGNDTLLGGGGDDVMRNGTFSFDGTSLILNGGGNDYFAGGAGDDRYTISKTSFTTLSDVQGINNIDIVGTFATDFSWVVNGNSLDLYDGANKFSTLVDATEFSQITLINIDGGVTNTIFSVSDIMAGTPQFIHTTGGDDIVSVATWNEGVGVNLFNGNDIFFGGDFDDQVTGSGGDDLLIGSAGNDLFFVSSGNNTVFGNDGNDTIFSTSSSPNSYINTLDGGAGFDQYNIRPYGHTTISDSDSANAITISLIDPKDIVFSMNGSDLLAYNKNVSLSSEFLTIQNAGSLADSIITLVPSFDSSSIYVAPILDVINGTGSFYEISDDDDFIDLSLAAQAIPTYKIEAHEGDISSTGAFLQAGDDVYIGSLFDDIVHGESGADTLSGIVGNDTLYGESGNDTLFGGAGDDVLYGGSGNDTIDGGEGNDILVGGSGNDTLSGGLGDDTYLFTSGDGFDTIDDIGGNDTLVIDGDFSLSDLRFIQNGVDLIIDIASGVTINGFFNSGGSTSLENLTFLQSGTTVSFDDVSIAPNQEPVAVDDTFWMDHDSLLKGNVLDDNGAGVDFDLEGSALTVEEDLFSTSAGGNVFLNDDGSFLYAASIGFIGQDSFTYTLSDDLGAQSIGTVTINVTPAAGDRVGTEGNDFLFGTQGDDTIFGLGGNDFLMGRQGDDMLSGGDGNDRLLGGMGDDVMIGGDGKDRLLGGMGDDTLSGGAEDDFLLGGAGDDYLSGGTGNDILFGGSGADIFVFEQDGGLDTVKDFNAWRHGDALDISDILTAFDPLEDDIADFVQLETNGYGFHRKTVVSVDADGGGDSFAAVAIIQGTHNIDLLAMLDNGSLIV